MDPPQFQTATGAASLAGDSVVEMGAIDGDPGGDSIPLGTDATIYFQNGSWYLVAGQMSPSGQVVRGANAVSMNGAPVGEWVQIREGASIEILQEGLSYRYTFHEPEAQRGSFTGEHAIISTGEPWFRALDADGRLGAFASFRGFQVKYPENQDRMFYRVRSDGSIFMVAIDGMGGHGGGEMAAELGRVAIERVIDSGGNLGTAINEANRAMYDTPEVRNHGGGAVAAGFHVRTDGQLEVRSVGDSEVLLLSLPANGNGPYQLDFWSTRPTFRQMAYLRVPVQADGRVQRGAERATRLDPNSNFVDAALGLFRDSILDSGQHAETVPLERGRVYVAIAATDGLMEQFIDHEDLMGIVNASSDQSAQGIRNALMQEGLLRCCLARMHYQNGGGPMEITRQRVAEAYREMMQELYGQGMDPPADHRWSFESCWIIRDGYVVRGVTDPAANVDFAGRFKQDNVSVGVVLFQIPPLP